MFYTDGELLYDGELTVFGKVLARVQMHLKFLSRTLFSLIEKNPRAHYVIETTEKNIRTMRYINPPQSN